MFDLDKIWAMMIAFAVGMFQPLWVLMLWFLIFVACDAVTGISASIKEGRHITSCGLYRTIQKVVMYSMAIFLLQAIDRDMITIMDLGLAKVGATIICGVEFYSILENCYRLTGNVVFKILTRFTLNKISNGTGVKLNVGDIKKTPKPRRKKNGNK